MQMMDTTVGVVKVEYVKEPTTRVFWVEVKRVMNTAALAATSAGRVKRSGDLLLAGRLLSAAVRWLETEL
jgi:hypothetical protein